MRSLLLIINFIIIISFTNCGNSKEKANVNKTRNDIIKGQINKINYEGQILLLDTIIFENKLVVYVTRNDYVYLKYKENIDTVKFELLYDSNLVNNNHEGIWAFNNKAILKNSLTNFFRVDDSTFIFSIHDAFNFNTRIFGLYFKNGKLFFFKGDYLSNNNKHHSGVIGTRNSVCFCKKESNVLVFISLPESEPNVSFITVDLFYIYKDGFSGPQLRYKIYNKKGMDIFNKDATTEELLEFYNSVLFCNFIPNPLLNLPNFNDF